MANSIRYRYRSHPRRLALLAAFALALSLASCGGGDDEQGLASARGVGRTFCDAFAELIGPGGDRSSPEFLVRTEQAAEAALEVLPKGAPRELPEFLKAIAEMTSLSRIWENPETGGIKEEYLDDFQRLTAVTLGDAAKVAARFASEECSGLPAVAGSTLGSLVQPSGGQTPGPTGTSATTTARPAEEVVLAQDGPSGTYERVTVNVGRVTATTDPGPASVLVEVELTATTAATNVFSAADFRLGGPGGAIAADTLVDGGEEPSSLQLRGRDSVRATVVFPTPALVRSLSGYDLRVDRDDRVPAVIPLTGKGAAPYPVALPAGATGAFRAPLTPACDDDYKTAVGSVGADLDADLGSPKKDVDVKRAARGRRWITVVLQVTNVTAPSQSPTGGCDASSGNYAGVELRLQADGRALAPANPPSFEGIRRGSTADRTHVFEVDVAARSFVLVGPNGEVLGRWTTDLPAAPGEG